MTLANDLWTRNLDLAQACLTNPFVRELADGTLPQATFAYYVGQDAFFLRAFARAYSLAAAKAPDFDGFRAFHTLADGVLAELQLHEGYAQAWGVDMTHVAPGPATRRYTDFLLATAWGQAVGVTAAAMSPCMRLYAYLGQELAHDGIPDHRYAEWIQTYGSPDFEALARTLEGLTDRYASPDELTHTTYRYAMQCELDFFQAAWDQNK
jgi:thiaminase/transcriptional activator TenA